MKIIDFDDRGAGALRGPAEFVPRVAFIMNSNKYLILKETEGFQWSSVLVHSAAPQNLSLKRPSIWKTEIK